MAVDDCGGDVDQLAVGGPGVVAQHLTEYHRLKPIPPFDEDDEPAPPRAVTHWRKAIDGADAILFATPEYNSSVPGQLKNAIDWASRPVNGAVLRNKPVAVIRASTGSFGALCCARRSARRRARHRPGSCPWPRPTKRLTTTGPSRTTT